METDLQIQIKETKKITKTSFFQVLNDKIKEWGIYFRLKFPLTVFQKTF